MSHRWARAKAHHDRSVALQQEPALQRIRQDLRVRCGAELSWRTEAHPNAAGLYQPRLIGRLRGQVDNAQRTRKPEAGEWLADDRKGGKVSIPAQHAAWQAAAFAMTVLSPLFEHAVIVGGGVAVDGSWEAVIWLDATAAESLAAEAAAAAAGL